MKNNMRYAFFLGCIMPNRYPGIEASMRNVAEALGIKLVDIDGASCCPPPGVVKSFHKLTWLVIAARNLSMAEALNSDATTLCNGCYGTLKEANVILKEDSAMREKVNKILQEFGKEFHGNIDVKHIVEVLYNDFGIEELRKFVKRPLNLNVAVHYGCHLLKPTKYRKVKNSERPTLLDELVEMLGPKSVPYRDKMMCCGAGGGLRSGYSEVSIDMTREKLENIKNSGADCIVTPCAFCHLQFDTGQVEIREKLGVTYNIPVLHYIQLLGLALGLEPEKLGLYNNAVPANSLIEKI
jgi:heterodisulfide reductase subunit B